MMTLRSVLAGIAANEDLNFLLTNRIPRRLATRFVGWISKIEQPLVRDLSIGLWRMFADLDLSDARTTGFRSLHDCFIRELAPGARPIDPDRDLLVSPCDAIVGANGRVAGTRVFQIKGFPYDLVDLLGDAALADAFRDGSYVTLRLTSSMYHRFHAPHDGCIESVTYTSGDTWNVNPIALKRIEALFCKNERATVQMRLDGGASIALVPVAAILVASMRFRFLGPDLDLRQGGSRTTRCDVRVRKGDELGWFQHGSTIVVLAPRGFTLCPGLAEGGRIRMGEPLMRLPLEAAGGPTALRPVADT
jgi:phosphatidylserine decarboxylase